MKEDQKAQIAKLRTFDTLVGDGHQVSLFELAGMLDVDLVEVNSMQQIPWARNLFIIVYDKTKCCIFDSLTGQIICRLGFEESDLIHVLFDVASKLSSLPIGNFLTIYY